MFTVIFVSNQLNGLLGDYRNLFVPFESREQIAFCSWNESAATIETAAPELYSIVQGKIEWRAVVLYLPGPAVSNNGYTNHNPDNPYDFAFNRNNAEVYFEENAASIVRFSHMLAGFPKLGNYKFSEDVDTFDNEYLERINLSKETVELKHKLTSSIYDFHEYRPTELILFSIREYVELNVQKKVKSAWNTELESNSSYFWKRNNYPSITRFVVFDMVSTKNSFYTRQLFTLWMTVLTMSLNEIEVNSLQAYRLYRANIEIDKEELGNRVSHHISKMTAAQNNISERLKQQPVTIFESSKDLLPNQEVPVTLDDFSSISVKVQSDDIGLFKDKPILDTSVWNDQIFGVRRNINSLFRLPIKASEIASERAKYQINDFYEKEYTLDKFQAIELTEKLNEIEAEMYDNSNIHLFNTQSFNAELSAQERRVLNKMSYRMRKQTALIGALIAFSIYALGFIPFILNSLRHNIVSFIFSVGIALISVLLISIGGLIVLWKNRRELLHQFYAFNHIVDQLIGNLRVTDGIIENYLSKVTTYMLGQSILQGVRFSKKSFAKVRQKLNLHYHALEAQISIEDRWAKAFDVAIKFQYIPSSMTYFDIDLYPNENHYYRFDEYDDTASIPLNSSGDMIVAPYQFIDCLILERLDLFDKSMEE